MAKRPEITERTKSIIIDAFWILYRSAKMHKISVNDIVNKAGYNRSTFYQYFMDTHDVLEQIEDSLIKVIAANVSEMLSSENEEDWIAQITDMYDSKSEYLSVLLGSNGDPMFLGKLKTVVRPIFINKIKIEDKDFQSELKLEFILSGIMACIMYWHNQGKPIPAEEIVFLVRSFIKKGILP